jgi:hypothetical protein
VCIACVYARVFVQMYMHSRHLTHLLSVLFCQEAVAVGCSRPYPAFSGSKRGAGPSWHQTLPLGRLEVLLVMWGVAPFELIVQVQQ